MLVKLIELYNVNVLSGNNDFVSKRIDEMAIVMQ